MENVNRILVDIINNIEKYEKSFIAEQLFLIVNDKSNRLEKLVMPMLTEIEVESGWEAWLDNSFKAYKKEFTDKLRKSNKRSGVIETPKKWIENYYKELLTITERYLNASKHSA